MYCINTIPKSSPYSFQKTHKTQRKTSAIFWVAFKWFLWKELGVYLKELQKKQCLMLHSFSRKKDNDQITCTCTSSWACLACWVTSRSWAFTEASSLLIKRQIILKGGGWLWRPTNISGAKRKLIIDIIKMAIVMLESLRLWSTVLSVW